MCDYFEHWLSMGARMKNPPKIFNVNWFRTDESGNYIWPGFGDNLRVIDWILRRCDGTVDAQETPIGYMPYPRDIDLTGTDVTVEQLASILDVDKIGWYYEADDIAHFYSKFGDKLPVKLAKQLRTLKKNLKE